MFIEVMMMILWGTREIMNCRPIGIQMLMEIVRTKYNDTWIDQVGSVGCSSKSCNDEEELSESNVSINEENNGVEGEQSLDSRDDSPGNDTNAKGKTAKGNDVVEELSQEDIEIFLENESVMAAQISSQEVRSHHVPHINLVFDTHDAAFDFYNTYSEIIGFSAKKGR
jgi:hypothetical protein